MPRVQVPSLTPEQEPQIWPGNGSLRLFAIRAQPAWPTAQPNLRQMAPRAGSGGPSPAGLPVGHLEHDVAGLLVGLDVAVRLDDLIEWVGSVDHRAVVAALDQPGEDLVVGLGVANGFTDCRGDSEAALSLSTVCAPTVRT